MGEKKVLTMLLGSPRKDGNSETLADAFAAGAAEKGYEVRKVRLAGMTLKGCLDCRRCWSAGNPCIQRDEMDKVYEDLEAADVIAFVSPLYYFSWSAQIKPVFDRLLPFGAKDAPRTLNDKKAVLIATAGDDEAEVFDGLRATYRLTVGYLGWENIGEVCAHGIYTRGEMAEKGAAWLSAAKELGGKL